MYTRTSYHGPLEFSNMFDKQSDLGHANYWHSESCLQKAVPTRRVPAYSSAISARSLNITIILTLTLTVALTPINSTNANIAVRQ